MNRIEQQQWLTMNHADRILTKYFFKTTKMLRILRRYWNQVPILLIFQATDKLYYFYLAASQSDSIISYVFVASVLFSASDICYLFFLEMTITLDYYVSVVVEKEM